MWTTNANNMFVQHLVFKTFPHILPVVNPERGLLCGYCFVVKYNIKETDQQPLSMWLYVCNF